VRSNGNISTTFVTNYGTGQIILLIQETTAAQTTGTELPVNATSLTINNANGVTLNSLLNTGTLNMHSGILTAASPDTLSVTGTTAASVTGGSATAYVKGLLRRSFPASVVAGSIYTFPIGNSATRCLK